MRALITTFCIAVTVFAGACGDSAEKDAIDRGQIQATLEAYLPRLAEAYESRSGEPLRGYAAEKEIAMIDKVMSELAAGGREIHATFLGVTIEDITTFGYANAYVTTVELWNVEVYSLGGQSKLSSEERRDRVKYQLMREGDQWLVLYRQRQDS